MRGATSSRKRAADVAHYRPRATQLLAQARPLLRVFTEEKRDEREKALGRLHGAYGDGIWRGGKMDGVASCVALRR